MSWVILGLFVVVAIIGIAIAVRRRRVARDGMASAMHEPWRLAHEASVTEARARQVSKGENLGM